MPSEYELARQRNVARNKEMLRQLGISVAEIPRAASPPRRQQPTPRVKNIPTRVSSRILTNAKRQKVHDNEQNEPLLSRRALYQPRSPPRLAIPPLNEVHARRTAPAQRSSSRVEGEWPQVRVAFTGIKNAIKKYEPSVSLLGGLVVESIEDCTHLISDRIVHTPKFLIAICERKCIVTSKWLSDSTELGEFQDVKAYVPLYINSNTNVAFDLMASLARARLGKIFDGLDFCVLPSCKHTEDIHAIIEAAGGNGRTRPPTELSHQPIIFVVDPNDTDLVTALAEKFSNARFVFPEFVAQAVLKQEINWAGPGVCRG